MKKKKRIKIWLLPFILMKRDGNHLHLQMVAMLYPQNFAVEKALQMRKIAFHELRSQRSYKIAGILIDVFSDPKIR